MVGKCDRDGHRCCRQTVLKFIWAPNVGVALTEWWKRGSEEERGLEDGAQGEREAVKQGMSKRLLEEGR